MKLVRILLFITLFGFCSGMVAGDRSDTLRRFLNLPRRRRAEILAFWRSLKRMPKKKRQWVIERLRRWLKLSERKRKMLLRRWRRWNSLRRRLMEGLPPDRRIHLLRLPPWKRDIELIQIFNRHMLGVYKRIMALLNDKEKERLLSLPQGRFLAEMRRLLERRRELALKAVLKNLPPLLRRRVEGGKVPLRVVLENRAARHKSVFALLRQRHILKALEHAPRMVRFVELELAWQRWVRKATMRLREQMMSLPLPRRHRFLSHLREGLLPEKASPMVRKIVSLPKEAREEVVMFVEGAPLAPPPCPR